MRSDLSGPETRFTASTRSIDVRGSAGRALGARRSVGVMLCCTRWTAPRVMEVRGMDGESFDRLSVVVHRLRDKATRRGALRLLLGSSAAAALVALEGESEARRRRRRRGRCKGFGGRCDSSRDCCDGHCRNGFCFPGGGGGGGNRCNGRQCQSGWECCRLSGVDVCVPRNHPTCFNNGFCPAGWKTCGFDGPVRNCCAPNERCCNNDDFETSV